MSAKLKVCYSCSELLSFVTRDVLPATSASSSVCFICWLRPIIFPTKKDKPSQYHNRKTQYKQNHTQGHAHTLDYNAETNVNIHFGVSGFHQTESQVSLQIGHLLANYYRNWIQLSHKGIFLSLLYNPRLIPYCP